MRRRVISVGDEAPLLDIVSYGRRGAGAHQALTREQISHASRTVLRVPEVMVKVTGGARSARGVAAHLDYIGREGKGEIESDDGRVIQEKGFEHALLEDWDLDLEAHRRFTERAVAAGRRPPKLVHNLIFSMPKGTPPEKVLDAVRRFGAEKFALQHRYAMALHRDQGAPHVHVVVKAVSEDGVRLNIRKATLREWRRDFAFYLRELGVEANATERAVRGEVRPSKPSSIYRPMKRGDSTHYRTRAEGVARELADGQLKPGIGKASLFKTRQEVIGGWLAFAQSLERNGQNELAGRVRLFAAEMPREQTEKEWIATELIGRREAARGRGEPMTRE